MVVNIGDRMDEKLEKIQKVVQILEGSDIVWGKYGVDTIPELAERIVTKLEIKDHYIFPERKLDVD